eukprot:scaffold66669_cov78-Phaeocystis_antarctica.AAC.3
MALATDRRLPSPKSRTAPNDTKERKRVQSNDTSEPEPRCSRRCAVTSPRPARRPSVALPVRSGAFCVRPLYHATNWLACVHAPANFIPAAAPTPTPAPMQTVGSSRYSTSLAQSTLVVASRSHKRGPRDDPDSRRLALLGTYHLLG